MESSEASGITGCRKVNADYDMKIAVAEKIYKGKQSCDLAWGGGGGGGFVVLQGFKGGGGGKEREKGLGI